MLRKRGVPALILFFMFWVLLPYLEGLDILTFMFGSTMNIILVAISVALVLVAFKPSRAPF